MKLVPTPRIVILAGIVFPLIAVAQQTPAPAPAPARADAGEILQLDAFTVSSSGDRGYQAEQSISGSRFVTDLKNFPFNLQVLTGGFLKDTGVVHLEEALAYANGIVANQRNQGAEIMVVQRGYLTSLQLRDGVRKPGGFDSAGAERIEIINGPASVLFGITNPGGTINYLSKKPVHKPLAEVSQSAGSWGTYRTTLDLGGPLGDSGTLAFRWPSSYYSTDGYHVNSVGRKAYTSPVIAWQVTPATKIEVGLELQKSDYIPITNLLAVLDESRFAFFIPRDFNGNTPNMFMHLQTTLPSLIIEHNLGRNWQVRSNSSFYTNTNDSYYAKRGAIRASQNFAYPRQVDISEISVRAFQHNTDLVGTFDVLNGTLTAIAGVEYQDLFNRTFVRTSNAPGGAAPPPWLMMDPSTWNYNDDSLNVLVTLADTTTKFESVAWSLLGQFKSRNGRLTLAGGVRHDSTTALFNDFKAQRLDQNFEAAKLTAQIGGLYWLKQDALSIYANYSSSFEPLTAPLIDINFQAFQPVPVTGQGGEVGLRQSLLGGRFVHSIGAYLIDQENLRSVLLHTSTSGGVSFFDTQGGLHRSKGVEYSFNGVLGEGWAVFGGYTYNDANVEKDDNPVAAQNTTGQRLPWAYRYKANAFVKYAFQSGPLKNLHLGAGYYYVSDCPQQLGSLNSVLINVPYGVVNLLGGYSWRSGEQDWSVQVNINNLFSRDYMGISAPNRSKPIGTEVTLRVKF